jgi:hypothetical protein
MTATALRIREVAPSDAAALLELKLALNEETASGDVTSS